MKDLVRFVAETEPGKKVRFFRKKVEDHMYNHRGTDIQENYVKE